jgi:hypothetical protein
VVTYPDFYDNMAVWKSRNKNPINNQDVAASETREVLKELIQNLVRKSWNVARFMEDGKRKTHQRALRVGYWCSRLIPGPNPLDFAFTLMTEPQLHMRSGIGAYGTGSVYYCTESVSPLCSALRSGSNTFLLLS